MSWLLELPVLIRGAIIGLAISAPVGPIGILCIQRTLADGRIVGLVTGLGAATADAFYGAVAALGVALIAEVLVDQQDLLRLLGGGILIFLAFRIFLSKPTAKPASQGKEGLASAYISTFILTLTNPVTIIFFAAIFAGVGIQETDQTFSTVAPLVLGVFLGSAFWWLLLSGGVSLLRDRVTPRGMRWINWGSGLLIAVFGASAIITAVPGLSS